MKHKKRKIIAGAVVIFVAAGISVTVLAVTGSRKNEADGVTKQSTIRLEKMDLTKSVSATGTIKSSQSKTVSAQVNNVKVKSVKVSVGDAVKKGDVLVSFDKSDLQSTLSDAQENLADVKEENQRNLSSAKKQLSEAKESASEEKEKLAAEVSEKKKEASDAAKSVSQLKKQAQAAKSETEKAKLEEQLAKAEEAEKQAKSAYETAVSNRSNTNKQNQKNIETAQDNVQNAAANQKKSIKEAQKQVDEAQKNLDECTVTAPMDGIVTASNVEEGEVYNGSDMFQIEDNSSYIVSTSVDEYDIGKVSEGQRVVILTEATDETEIEGEITFVAPSTGSTALSSGNSQTEGSAGLTQTSTSSEGYAVEIGVRAADERLRMGMTAKCSIILEEADDVYAVPYDAIQEKADGTTVISVISPESKEIQVSKGMESDYYVEITGEELSEGMRVVIPTDEVSAKSEESTEESGFGIPDGTAPEGGRPDGLSGEGNPGGFGGGERGNRGNGNAGGGRNVAK